MEEKAFTQYFSKELILGSMALISAIPLAFLIHYVNHALPYRPERAIEILSSIFLILLLLPTLVYAIFRFKLKAPPTKLELILLATFCVLLASVYFYRVSFYILFPADILIWSESDFVNDILKFSTGYPIYSSFENNESQVYPPGAQIITFYLAKLLGYGKSIFSYRLIQMGFALITAFLAAGCFYLLRGISSEPKKSRKSLVWGALSHSYQFLNQSFYSQPSQRVIVTAGLSGGLLAAIEIQYHQEKTRVAPDGGSSCLRVSYKTKFYHMDASLLFLPLVF
jgi:hypothetical protein